MPTLKSKERIGNLVEDFYNRNPFPGFDLKKYVLKDDLYRQANVYARMLDDQIPWGAAVLDAGCGTGQLACLLSLKDRRTVGTDFSERSISKAIELKEKLRLTNLSFRKDDLMNMKMEKEPFDYIFCHGVLHHTADPYLGFQNLLPYAKKGTYIIVGLYNRYGRLWHRLKCRRLRRKKEAGSEYSHSVVRQMLFENEEDREKLETWYVDQYLHPFEHTHSIGEVLSWFRKNEIGYVSSLPFIELFRREKKATGIFKDSPMKFWQDSSFSFFLKQLKWIISLSKTGGYFMMVGRRK